MSRKSVVLPWPLRPTRPTRSLRLILKLMLSKRDLLPVAFGEVVDGDHGVGSAAHVCRAGTGPRRFDELGHLHGPERQRREADHDGHVEQAQGFDLEDALGEREVIDGDLEQERGAAGGEELPVREQPELEERLGLAPAVEGVEELAAGQGEQGRRPGPVDALRSRRTGRTGRRPGCRRR